MNLNDDFDFDDNAFDEPQSDEFAGLDDSGGDRSEERRSRRRGGGLPSINLGALTGNPIAMLVLGGILGLAFGLLFAWQLWPVQWYDADITHLRADLREDWLRMTIDSYALRPELDRFQGRFESLGETAPSALATVEASPGAQNQEAILLLRQLQNQGGVVVAPIATDPATGQTVPDAPAAGSNTLALFAVCFFATLILGGVLLFLYFRSRGRGGRSSAPQTAAQAASRYSQAAEKTDFTALGQTAPVAQYMTTYLIGDDLFDDSFSIDAVAGEFLGECGVGVADTIGVGEPKRVTAFEIWLFDKNDIQTITKVIMSNHVYNDDAGRERLSAKGEPVLARPGAEAVLETETLQMVARVVDMAYGEGALPANSFFDRLTLELAIWQK
ncbi:MAG: hypothetical protein HYZ26_04155 [Chloroflexi bacterium]|nr:hypothetical protein [Chloroflexota bacterium]